MMHWQSWQDFWAMGGYALYVWASFGVSALMIVLECWQLSNAWHHELELLRASVELDSSLASVSQSSEKASEMEQPS